MKYFCLPSEQEGSCYHEFYRGKWVENDFWNPNSLLLHDDVLMDTELYQAFHAVLPHYAYYGITEVTAAEWSSVQKYAAEHLGAKAQEALAEAEDWLHDIFEKEGVLSILGI